VPVEPGLHVDNLDAVNSTNRSKWRTTVTITIVDDNQNPVANAKVYAVWSYGTAKDCTTDASGQCSLVSNEYDAAQMSSIGLTINNVAHNTLVYKAAANIDSDGNSDGTTIVKDRPVPAAMFVADLDGSSYQHDRDEWRATVTVTVLNASQEPVAGADLFFTWSNNKSNDCTTDSSGQCNLTSDKLKNAEVDAISFTVTNLTHDQSLLVAYDPSRNFDPDGDSDGNQITINKP